MGTDRKARAPEAVKEMHRGDAAAVALRYGMSLADAERLLDDLRSVFARWAFDPIDTRAEALHDRKRDTRRRVLDVLPKAMEQATAEAKRYGLAKPKASAVNALAAKMAGVSTRTVERIRAGSIRPPK